MKIVKSPYLRILAGKGKSILYHSLYGNPVNVDHSVIDMLRRLSSPCDLEVFANRGKDVHAALGELIRLGFVVSDDKCDEREKWTSLIHKRYVQAELFSAGLVFVVTTECNFSCDYCIAKHTLPHLGAMSFLTAKKALDLYVQRIRSINESNERKISIAFTGGEPLLEFDVITMLCDYANTRYRDIAFNFRLVTNGSLITTDIAQYLQRNRFDVDVSIDGEKESNDSARKYPDGSGTSDSIWNGLYTLFSLGDNCNISVSSLYHSDHPNGFNKNFFRRLSSLSIGSVSLNIDNLSLLPVSPSEMAERFVSLRSIAREEGINLSGMWTNPAWNIRSKSPMLALCSGAVRSRLFVLPDGSLPFCEYHPSIMGHLESFDKFYNKMQASPNNYLFGWTKCRGCEIEGFCSPCVLERESIHKNNPIHQQQKCEFLRHCTRMLLLED